MPNFFLLKKRKKEYDLEEERRHFQESLRGSAEGRGRTSYEVYRTEQAEQPPQSTTVGEYNEPANW